MLVDSHCHLSYPDFSGDLLDIIQRAQAVGIGHFLNICTKLEEADVVYDLARQFPYISATVGVHPHEATATRQVCPDWYAHLEKRLVQPKIVGLGETGLDYYYEHSTPEDQEVLFRGHCALAKAYDVPLIIHTRDAEEDTIRILDDYPGVRGVFHCFSSSAWLCQQALDRGFYISLSGILTFKKADDLREVAKTVPVDRFLVETDAPFLAPVPYRGKRNEPAMMVETVKVLAEIKGLSIQVVTEQTTRNFLELFNRVVL